LSFPAKRQKSEISTFGPLGYSPAGFTVPLYYTLYP